MRLKTSLLGAAAAVGLALTAGTASASILTNFQSVTASATHTGAFDFTYGATLDASQQITNGSYFVLYDWGPALSPIPTTNNLVNASNWTFTQQLSTPNPTAGGLTASAPDNPGILNVVASYNGATVTGTSLGGGANDLGTFVLTSPSGGTQNGYEAAMAQHYNPGDPTTNGTGAVNASTTVIPKAVPEPASLALLGGGLMGLGVLRRRKR